MNTGTDPCEICFAECLMHSSFPIKYKIDQTSVFIYEKKGETNRKKRKHISL